MHPSLLAGYHCNPFGSRIYYGHLVIYPKCEHCRKPMWHHAKHHCVFAITKYEPSHTGVAVDIINGVIQHVTWYKESQTWAYRDWIMAPEGHEIVTEVLLVNYLMDLGWNP